MLNKQLEITLGNEKVLLWFNNFAVFELQKKYGVDQGEILEKVSEIANENYLLLISDLIKIGIKGNCLANGLKTPNIYDNVTQNVAVADLNEMIEVWNVFFDIMGGNIEVEDKKKAQQKKVKVK